MVSKEGREDAAMDREEKVVGSVLKTREVVGSAGRRGGSGRIPMEMVSGWRRD